MLFFWKIALWSNHIDHVYCKKLKIITFISVKKRDIIFWLIKIKVNYHNTMILQMETIVKMVRFYVLQWTTSIFINRVNSYERLSSFKRKIVICGGACGCLSYKKDNQIILQQWNKTKFVFIRLKVEWFNHMNKKQLRYKCRTCVKLGHYVLVTLSLYQAKERSKPLKKTK